MASQDDISATEKLLDIIRTKAPVPEGDFLEMEPPELPIKPDSAGDEHQLYSADETGIPSTATLRW